MSASVADIPSPPGYSIDKKLGEGGFGVVYKATHRETGRLCAMKAVDISGMRPTYKGLARAEWKKEVSVLIKAGNHPGIVKYRSSLDAGDMLWVEMEFCTGGDLQSYYWEKGLSRPLKRQFMLEISAAVAYLHGRKIIHRDLKPENILISYDASQIPRAKVADFGLAQAIAATSFAGRLDKFYLDATCGTKYYMAPEVFQGKYTYKADIFSLSILFKTLIRETAVGRYMTNCAVDSEGIVWPCGEYMYKTQCQLVMNTNAVVGDKLRNLVNDMGLLDYTKRPTADEVYERLQSSISAGDFDERPRSRAGCTVAPPDD